MGPALAAEGRRIAGRYAVEAELSRGGMGVVYRVRDQESGRCLALKRAHTGGEASTALARAVALQHEYQLLVTLKHPRIIEVYDSGHDEAGPYYTMELLDGADIRTLAPLAWAQVCKVLRDVASSLALMHTRGLMHRDVSPGNIRITDDGRAKLLDFGTVAGFGRQGHVAGTAPCVAPEVLDGKELNQGVDMYALGATAYFALCGVYPYPARSFDQLRALWAAGEPVPPSALVADIPVELDHLVLSLLSLDPMARPTSVAEVIDRLSALAQLPDDHDDRVVASYLQRPRLVGRAPQLAAAVSALRVSLAGRSAALLVEAAPGLGKSAFVEEVMVEAQLHGVAVVASNGRLHQTPYSLCRALVRQSLRAHGEHVRACVGSRLLAFAEAASVPQTDAALLAPTNEAVPHLQAEFVAALRAIARLRPLLIALDDAADADTESLAVLAALVSSASDQPLLFVGAAEREALERTVALRVIGRSATQLCLGPLKQVDVEQLVHSTFGAIPSAMRLSTWLIEQTAGKPRQCMEALGLLLDRGALRYSAGIWDTAHELPALALDDKQLSQRRISALKNSSRALATHLSVVQGAVSLDLCHALGAQRLGMSRAEVERSLTDLTVERVLLESEFNYAFAQPHLAAVLYQDLPPLARTEAHRVVARQLMPRTLRDALTQLQVGWHLTLAGDVTAASRHLAEAYSRVAKDAVTLVRAVPLLVALRAHYRGLGLSQDQQLDVTTPIIIAGIFDDPRVHDRLGEQTIRLLERRSGLSVTRWLYRVIGTFPAFFLGICCGYIRYLLTSRRYRLATFDYPFAYFGACIAVCSSATFRLDQTRLAWLARQLSPVAGLSRKRIPRLIYQLITRISPNIVSGRYAESSQELHATLEDLKLVADLDPGARLQFESNLRFWLGRVALFATGDCALQHAELIARSPFIHDTILAEYLRNAYHLQRGEPARAEPHRQRLDALTTQCGSSWLVDVLCATDFVHLHRAGDLIGVKRCVTQLNRLIGMHPGMRQHRDLAVALYESLRGNAAVALDLHTALEGELSPFTHPYWSVARAHQAECLNTMGRHAEAAAVCERALLAVGAYGDDVALLHEALEREWAIAAAGLGRVEDAAQRLEAQLTRHALSGHPLLLGLLHRDRARVAAMAGEHAIFLVHVRECVRLFGATQHPALIAQARRLERLWVAPARPRENGVCDDFPQQLAELLAGPRTSEPLELRVLSWVAAQVGAARARLYLTRGITPTLSAELGEATWPDDLDQRVAQLALETSDETETANLDLYALAGSGQEQWEGSPLLLVPLLISGAAKNAVVAVLALGGCEHGAQPDFSRQQALAIALHALQGGAVSTRE